MCIRDSISVEGVLQTLQQNGLHISVEGVLQTLHIRRYNNRALNIGAEAVLQTLQQKAPYNDISAEAVQTTATSRRQADQVSRALRMRFARVLEFQLMLSTIFTSIPTVAVVKISSHSTKIPAILGSGN